MDGPTSKSHERFEGIPLFSQNQSSLDHSFKSKINKNAKLKLTSIKKKLGCLE